LTIYFANSKIFIIGYCYLASLSVDWIEFYGLRGDPFSAAPLENKEDFHYLFVKTEDITRFIDPLIKHFVESKPSLLVIGGPRGVGKSTALYYLYEQLSQNNRVVVAIVKEEPAIIQGMTDPMYGIGTDTIFQIVLKLLHSLRYRFPEFIERHKSELIKIAEVVGFDIEQGWATQVEEPSYGWLTGILRQLCKLLKEEQLRALVEIDNYDRLNPELATKFLRSDYAQPVLEALQNAGTSIVLTAGDNWLQQIQSDPDFSYIGKPVMLKPLNPSECEELVHKRLQSMLKETSKDRASYIFDSDAILSIALAKNGVPRDVLEICRACLIKAAQKGASIVSKEIAEEVLIEEKTNFGNIYEIISSSKAAQQGLSKLQDLKGSLEYTIFKKSIQNLEYIFEGWKNEDKEQSQKLDKDIVDHLRLAGLVYSVPPLDPSAPAKLVLETHVEVLFKELDKEKMLHGFVEWFTRASQQRVIKVISPKEKESRDDIRARFTDLIDKAPSSIARVLREAFNTYEALLYELQGEDADARQIFSKFFTILKEVGMAAINFHRLVDQKLSINLTISEEQIEDLLIEEKAYDEVRKFSEIMTKCRIIGKGSPVRGEKPLAMLLDAEHVISTLLKYCSAKLSYALKPTESRLVRVSSLEEISKRISSRLKGGSENYFVSFKYQHPYHEFILIGWTYRNRIYANLYDKSRKTIDADISHYSYNIREAWMPGHAREEVVRLGLEKPFGLSFYNPYELVKCLSILSKDAHLITQFISRESNAKLELYKGDSDKDIAYSFDPYLPTTYGAPFTELESFQTPKGTIKMRPDKPFQNYLTIGQLLQSLSGDILVEDKDFDEEGLKLLHENLNLQQIRRLRVLLSTSHVSDRFKKMAALFKNELGTKMEIEFRVVDEQDGKELHDRYIIDDINAYNVPPLNIIHKKLSDIKLLNDRGLTLDLLNKYWDRARKLEKLEGQSIQSKRPLQTKRSLEQLANNLSELKKNVESFKRFKSVIPTSRLRSKVSSYRSQAIAIKREVQQVLRDLMEDQKNTVGIFTPEDLQLISEQIEKAKGLITEADSTIDELSKLGGLS